MTTHLTTALQQRIFEHLENTYPNEGGGFLLGDVEGEIVRVRDTVAVQNVFEEAEQYHRYAMTPQDWMRLEDTAEERGLTLLGYYHSHPDSPPIPSVYDREHALPNFTYIIVGVEGGNAVEARVWRLRNDRTQFDSDTLHVSGEQL